jgi:hypothetical protein
MKKWLLAMFVCTAPVVSAQFPGQDREVKVVELKYTDANRIRGSGLLDPFGIQISATGQTLILGGSPSNVAAAEAFLRKFDVSPRNVEAVFYIVAASSKTAETAAIPSELEPVIKQLRKTFTYQSFRLLESAVVRGRENAPLQTSGQLLVPSKPEDLKRTYHLFTDRVSISPSEKGNMVRFDRLRFTLRAPDYVVMNLTKKAEYIDSGVNADIDVREGQKVVVGKSSLDAAEGTFFLIVTAKVVD